MDILKTIQEEREAFNALPTSEKIKQNREARVASLLNVGYITPDEAKTYREQLNGKELAYLRGEGEFWYNETEEE